MSESKFPKWDGFPVKYATCTIDVKAGLFQMTWIGYQFEPHGDLVKQYRLMDKRLTYEEAKEAIESWSEEERHVSHRVTYKEGSLTDDNPIPFHGKLSRGNRGKGLFAQWVHEQLNNSSGHDPAFDELMGINEVTLTRLGINLQKEFEKDYYSALIDEEGVSFMIPYVAPSRGHFENQWVEIDLIDTTLKVNGYETRFWRPKGYPEEIECAEYSPAEEDVFHAQRIYKKIGDKLHYFTTVSEEGYLPLNAAPPDTHIAMDLIPSTLKEDCLVITLLESAKDLLDQYEPKVSPTLLKLPKKEGVLFATKEGHGLSVNFEQDKIVGGRVQKMPQGDWRPANYAFQIALEDITDKDGFITSKAINKYYKKTTKNLTESYSNLAESVGVDEHIYDTSEDGEFLTEMNLQGRVLTAAKASVRHGFLNITATNYESIAAEEDESTKELFLYSLKALLLLRMPSVRKQIKRDTADYIKSLPPRKKTLAKKNNTKFWGSDKIRYLYPKKGEPTGRGTRYHFVRGFVRRLSNGTLTDVKPHYRGDLGLGVTDSALVFGTPEGKGGYSQVALDWIKSIEKKLGIRLQHAESGGEYRIPLANGKHYKVDGYCEETKTIYEFHGDYYHGNPAIYAPETINTTVNKTMGELYQATLNREEFLRNGWNLVVIWESEWYEQQEVKE